MNDIVCKKHPYENTIMILDEHGQVWIRNGDRFVLHAPDVNIYFEIIDGKMVYNDEAKQYLEKVQ